MKFVNPFKFGKEVDGYQFYDRQEDARCLRQRMIDGSSNVVLFAPRRYGKTSLVQKVLGQLAVSELGGKFARRILNESQNVRMYALTDPFLGRYLLQSPAKVFA